MTTEQMTLLDDPRVAAPLDVQPPALAPLTAGSPTMSSTLPITIERPRGGVFPDRGRRAAVRPASRQGARDVVLSAIWPLVGSSAGPAPSPATATICDAAVARIRAMIGNAVVSFRIRLGTVARDFDGGDRVAVEDFALMLKVDEAELLDRTVGLLSPQDLVSASVPGRHSVSAAAERAVASLVDMHMLGLVRSERLLSETTKALALLALSEPRG